MALDAANMELPGPPAAPLCLIHGESRPAAAVRGFEEALLGVVGDWLDSADPVSVEPAPAAPTASSSA
jgi:hypothetical protein